MLCKRGGKMIDTKNIKEEFLRYTSNYNPENERIKAKINHTLRVARKLQESC